MAVKTALLAGLVALPLASIGLSALTGATVVLSLGGVSVTYGWHKGVGFDIDPACYVTHCPIAALHIGRTDEPDYPIAI